MNYRFFFTFFAALLLITLLPGAAFAAEGAVGVNPPGWVGGSLAALALALAIGTSIWVRNKKL